MWHAVFREDTPISGDVTEAHFSVPSAHGAWVWVDFVGDGEAWCACLRAGRSCPSARRVATADGRHVFVLVGGLWYCIDAALRELRHASSDVCYVDLLVVPGTDRVAIADLTTVTIADGTKIVWETPQIAWDGVRLLRASARAIVGLAEGWSGEREFHIDLNALTVSGGHVADFSKNRSHQNPEIQS